MVILLSRVNHLAWDFYQICVLWASSGAVWRLSLPQLGLEERVAWVDSEILGKDSQETALCRGVPYHGDNRWGVHKECRGQKQEVLAGQEWSINLKMLQGGTIDWELGVLVSYCCKLPQFSCLKQYRIVTLQFQKLEIWNGFHRAEIKASTWLAFLQTH